MSQENESDISINKNSSTLTGTKSRNGNEFGHYDDLANNINYSDLNAESAHQNVIEPLHSNPHPTSRELAQISIRGPTQDGTPKRDLPSSQSSEEHKESGEFQSNSNSSEGTITKKSKPVRPNKSAFASQDGEGSKESYVKVSENSSGVWVQITLDGEESKGGDNSYFCVSLEAPKLPKNETKFSSIEEVGTVDYDKIFSKKIGLARDLTIYSSIPIDSSFKKAVYAIFASGNHGLHFKELNEGVVEEILNNSDTDWVIVIGEISGEEKLEKKLEDVLSTARNQNRLVDLGQGVAEAVGPKPRLDFGDENVFRKLEVFLGNLPFIQQVPINLEQGNSATSSKPIIIEDKSSDSSDCVIVSSS